MTTSWHWFGASAHLQLAYVVDGLQQEGRLVEFVTVWDELPQLVKPEQGRRPGFTNLAAPIATAKASHTECNATAVFRSAIVQRGCTLR